MQKTIRHWWKKLKMIQTDGEIYHILELEESTLWKWLYYTKQSTDSVQSLSNYPGRFSQNWKKKFYNLYGNINIFYNFLTRVIRLNNMQCQYYTVLSLQNSSFKDFNLLSLWIYLNLLYIKKFYWVRKVNAK